MICFVSISLLNVLSSKWCLQRIALLFFFFMIRRPPRSPLSSSSAASDVYKRQLPHPDGGAGRGGTGTGWDHCHLRGKDPQFGRRFAPGCCGQCRQTEAADPCSTALSAVYRTCLLYTSDAADEEDSVDLGGRRLNKKKNK